MRVASLALGHLRTRSLVFGHPLPDALPDDGRELVTTVAGVEPDLHLDAVAVILDLVLQLGLPHLMTEQDSANSHLLELMAAAAAADLIGLAVNSSSTGMFPDLTGGLSGEDREGDFRFSCQ